MRQADDYRRGRHVVSALNGQSAGGAPLEMLKQYIRQQRPPSRPG